MSVVSNMPHLRDIRLSLQYRELPENETQLMSFAPTSKWRNDPDASQLHGFAPGTKYFVNGALVGEHRPGMSVASKTPPPEIRVPRRGLVAVSVDDPEFMRLCKEQNIDPSSFGSYGRSSPKLPNGVVSTPKSALGKPNGRSPSHPSAVNGSSSSGAVRSPSLPGGQHSRPAVNGVNGTKHH